MLLYQAKTKPERLKMGVDVQTVLKHKKDCMTVPETEEPFSRWECRCPVISASRN